MIVCYIEILRLAQSSKEGNISICLNPLSIFMTKNKIWPDAKSILLSFQLKDHFWVEKNKGHGKIERDGKHKISDNTVDTNWKDELHIV